jgi:1-acyl-sn-glycerol-3-phosphate acyltransferase
VPKLIVANHVSEMDFFALASVFSVRGEHRDRQNDPL